MNHTEHKRIHQTINNFIVDIEIKTHIYCAEIAGLLGVPVLSCLCHSSPRYQKYHPTPGCESSSASGLINGERLFEVVYGHAFGL